MQIAILGPLEVRDGDRAVEVSGVRLRRLLTRLAMDGGRAVSAAQLVQAVWPDDAPHEVSNALQSLVSRLRRLLGDASLIVQMQGGYRLVVGPADVDAAVFSSQVRVGRAELDSGDAATAARTLRDALRLWRGEPLADLEMDGEAGAVARWRQLRLDALAARIEADLALGRAADLIPELEQLVAEHPLREQFTAALLRALRAAGRTSEALAAYERHREFLADQLGTDPSAELRELHLELLREGEPVPPTPLRRRTNLRATLTSFIGRDDELKRVAELLDGGRLVTIVGPGGAGKTRLSAEAARAWIDRMPGGVWFAELAPVTNAADVAPTVLDAFGLRETSAVERRTERMARDATERLLDALSDSECLLVVDNCEHLITPVAELIEVLLGNCPGLRVLATSREPLGVTGEALCALSSLDMPPTDAGPADALAYPAVRLFADRAGAVRAGFAVDDATVGSVVEIVRRLDGLPLAIELAAARLRVLPVGEIAARLDHRFRLLTSGSRTALPRHQTLHAVVQWSWDLLTDAERLLAERVSVFPAGVTVASAVAVCADGSVPGDEVEQILDSLVDKSLLQVADARRVRYRMLETIREFGTERLSERGDRMPARAAHAAYFADLVAAAEPHLRRAEQVGWLERLGSERDNIYAALRFFADTDDRQSALKVVRDLNGYWLLLGNHGEGAAWSRFALQVRGTADDVLTTLVEGAALLNQASGAMEQDSTESVPKERLQSIGTRLADLDLGGDVMAQLLRMMIAWFSEDVVRAKEYADRAIAGGDPWTAATMHLFRASMAENDGDVEQMRAGAAAALALFCEIGDRWGMSSALSMEALLRTYDGDLDGALEGYRRAAELMEQLGAASENWMMYMRMADIELRRGNLDEARRYAELLRSGSTSTSQMGRTLATIGLLLVARARGDRAEYHRLADEVAAAVAREPTNSMMAGHEQALGLAILGHVAVEGGDGDRARECLRGAWLAGIRTGDMPVMAAVGTGVARLARFLGRPADAAEMLGAAARLRGADDPTDLITAAETAALETALGPDFGAAYAHGRSMTKEHALARLDPVANDLVAATAS